VREHRSPGEATERDMRSPDDHDDHKHHDDHIRAAVRVSEE
jgi:hypothetical protein